mmetsp:Transcript_27308/g.71446  ORF Transcript_27308/g.71446 Transcript_27308/m.71446 type:complete len:204 (-) Transcript_27308:160-771(-)
MDSLKPFFCTFTAYRWEKTPERKTKLMTCMANPQLRTTQPAFVVSMPHLPTQCVQIMIVMRWKRSLSHRGSRWCTTGVCDTADVFGGAPDHNTASADQQKRKAPVSSQDVLPAVILSVSVNLGCCSRCASGSWASRTRTATSWSFRPKRTGPPSAPSVASQASGRAPNRSHGSSSATPEKVVVPSIAATGRGVADTLGLIVME